MFLKQYWVWCFLAVLLADTVALAFQWYGVHFILKLLLMPILIIGLLRHKRNLAEKNWRVILAGLITAWAGDTLLLFSTNMAIFFTLGLVCFLGTHLAYIVYFMRYKKGRRTWFFQHPILTFLVILYSILLYGFLSPHLGMLQYPVAIYTLVISIMVLQALSVQPFLPAVCNKYFVAGAVAFVISDSVLAIAKFDTAFFLSESITMLTYGVAQLLIVSGTILNTDKAFRLQA